jgi:hypothetical protein
LAVGGEDGVHLGDRGAGTTTKGHLVGLEVDDSRRRSNDADIGRRWRATSVTRDPDSIVSTDLVGEPFERGRHTHIPST